MTDNRGREQDASPVAFDDARMESIMGRLLQVGVFAAAATVLVGGVLYLYSHRGGIAAYRQFVARPLNVRHVNLLGIRLAAGDASAIIDLGILLLIATPICRVLFAVIGFALERDRLYVAISVTVLIVLLASLLRGG